jgi:hypothetical protein
LASCPSLMRMHMRWFIGSGTVEPDAILRSPQHGLQCGATRSPPRPIRWGEGRGEGLRRVVYPTALTITFGAQHRRHWIRLRPRQKVCKKATCGFIMRRPSEPFIQDHRRSRFVFDVHD